MAWPLVTSCLYSLSRHPWRLILSPLAFECGHTPTCASYMLASTSVPNLTFVLPVLASQFLSPKCMFAPSFQTLKKPMCTGYLLSARNCPKGFPWLCTFSCIIQQTCKLRFDSQLFRGGHRAQRNWFTVYCRASQGWRQEFESRSRIPSSFHSLYCLPIRTKEGLTMWLRGTKGWVIQGISKGFRG